MPGGKYHLRIKDFSMLDSDVASKEMKSNQEGGISGEG
jgi:hypothetical protein